MTPSEAVRTILRYAALGLAVVVVAGVAAFLLQQGQVREVERLAASNRKLIEQVDTLNRRQADQAYRECVGRNTRAAAAQQYLSRQSAAHRKDGDRHAQAWAKGYVKRLRASKLPPCRKPTA